MKKRNYFWGFVLVLMAVCLIAGQYDVFEGISLWKIVLSILGGAVVLDGLVNLSIEGVVIGGVILCFLWKNQLGLRDLSGWTILLAAILLTIGLKIIFHPFKMKIDAWKMRRKMRKYDRQIAAGNKKGSQAGEKDWKGHYHDAMNQDFTENKQGYDGSYVMLKRNFGGGIEYIRSNDFQCADIQLAFSGLKVYFDDAVIQGTEATLCIATNFSGLELYIPSEWAVEDQLHYFAGGTEVKQRPQNIAPTKTLRLEGNVAFGGVTIQYF